MDFLMARLMYWISYVWYINIQYYGFQDKIAFFKFLWSLNSLKRREYITKHRQIKEFVLKASELR